MLSRGGIPMYWTRVSLSSYNLTATGFRIRVYNETDPKKEIKTDIVWFAFQL